MHIETVGAAIDLGGARDNEVGGVWANAAPGQIFLQREHGVKRAGVGFGVIQSGLHVLFRRFGSPLSGLHLFDEAAHQGVTCLPQKPASLLPGLATSGLQLRIEPGGSTS